MKMCQILPFEIKTAQEQNALLYNWTKIMKQIKVQNKNTSLQKVLYQIIKQIWSVFPSSSEKRSGSFSFDGVSLLIHHSLHYLITYNYDLHQSFVMSSSGAVLNLLGLETGALKFKILIFLFLSKTLVNLRALKAFVQLLNNKK